MLRNKIANKFFKKDKFFSVNIIYEEIKLEKINNYNKMISFIEKPALLTL